MTNIRRHLQIGNIYFLTHVTFQRMPILVENYDILENAFMVAQHPDPFGLPVWVILPDHMHLIVDPRRNNLSSLMKRIKQSFSMVFRKRSGYSGRVWQYRFWDHVIRDENDLGRHMNYIFYNPVKHHLSADPYTYPYSSLSVRRGKVPYWPEWTGESPQKDSGAFGE